MARRRRRNPVAPLALVALGAVVLGAGYAVYAAVRPSKKKVAKKRKGACEDGFELRNVDGLPVCVPAGDPTPSIRGTKGVSGQYVGAPGYTQWPYQDLYTNEGAFIRQLEDLGYDPGTSLTSEQGRDAIHDFQSDHNLVASKIDDWMWPALTATKPKTSIGDLSPDGRLGAKTIHALVLAVGLEDAAKMSWQRLVELTPEELPGGHVDIGEEEIEFVPAPESGEERLVFPEIRFPLEKDCQNAVRIAIEAYVNNEATKEGVVNYVLECALHGERYHVLSYVADVAAANGFYELYNYAMLQREK